MTGVASSRGLKRTPPLTAIQQLYVVCFGLMLLSDALAAYTIMGLPVPWLSFVFALAGLGAHLIGARGRLLTPPTSAPAILLLVYALFIHLVTTVLGGHTVHMPPGAPISYDLFIASRFVTIAGFIIVLVFTYNTARALGKEWMVTLIKGAGILVCLAAIYIYVAQVQGLWEPPRTRMGTGGQEYIGGEVAFTYSFHRALGTFREPSHLMAWLIGPIMLLALTHRSLWGVLGLVCGVLVVVLTGSLLGALSLVAGFGLIAFIMRSQIWRMIGFTMVVIMTSTFALQAIGVDFAGVMAYRLGELFEEGVSATNRASAYEYVISAPRPLAGYGLGNANLALSEYNSSGLINSHLSLFVNKWFSLGLPGLAIAAWVVLRPLMSRATWRAAMLDRSACALLGSVAAWIVVFAGHSEELTVAFAVVCGVLWASAEESLASPRHTQALH